MLKELFNFFKLDFLIDVCGCELFVWKILEDDLKRFVIVI